MGAQRLSSRAIIGRYYKTLEQDTGAAWIGAISNLFQSNQPSEEYPWLGQAPAMREWIGGRQAKGFRENGIVIKNRLFEATLEVNIDELRRDKTGQIMVRVDEMAQRTNAHWASLLTTLIISGESTVCYDGQFFFDTDHTEGENTTNQSNDISIDISALPTSVHGAAATAPSVEEFQLAVAEGVTRMTAIKDDQNEPMNENARSFLVMVPVPLMQVASKALYVPSDQGMAGSQTTLASMRNDGFSISYVTNARLTWTDKFAIFRTDSAIKPLIRQEETGVEMKAIAEGSELEFKHRKHEYGVETWRNVAFGMWQYAMLVTMT
jgi:phage major head subunit gpT-like protein